MELLIEGNKDGLEFHLKVNWKSVRALITTLLALSMMPELHKLGTIFGWW